MPTFITVTHLYSTPNGIKKQALRLNFEEIESYSLADKDSVGKTYIVGVGQSPSTWYTEETPEAIDRLLQLARNPNAAPQYDPAMSPSMDVRDAKVHSRITIRSEFTQADKEWIQDVFGSNSQARTFTNPRAQTFTGTNYIVTVNDAMEIARIISDRTLRDIERTFRP